MISVVQLGAIDYATGLRLQQQLVALRKEGKIGDVLLLLEHSPVITLGRNAKTAHVVSSRELLAQRGVELFECDRGGDVTFHGPGQIVGYPIFDLRGFRRSSTNFKDLSSRAEENDSFANRSLESRDLAFPARKHLGAVDFVRRLEEVLIRTCVDFAIPSKRVPGLTGVWTDVASAVPSPLSFRADSNSLSSRGEPEDSRGNLPAESRDLLFPAPTANPSLESKLAAIGNGHVGTGGLARPVERSSTAAPTIESKLAAIGVHISRFVTSHGFALNVNTDLSYFNLIIPCGITSKPVTSMQEQLGHELDLNPVAQSISRNFGVVFQSQILWVDTLDALLGRTVGVPMKPPAELRRLRKEKEEDTTWA